MAAGVTSVARPGRIELVTGSTAHASNAGLAVHTFGDGAHIAIALHGITASAMAWPVVARALPPDWTLLAPDLRGRGASAGLAGPYGLDRHADDICALAQDRGGGIVLAGHSMGAWVALLAAGDAQRAVDPAQPRARVVSAQHGDFVTQDQNLDVLGCLGAGKQRQPAQHAGEHQVRES